MTFVPVVAALVDAASRSSCLFVESTLFIWCRVFGVFAARDNNCESLAVAGNVHLPAPRAFSTVGTGAGPDRRGPSGCPCLATRDCLELAGRECGCRRPSLRSSTGTLSAGMAPGLFAQIELLGLLKSSSIQKVTTRRGRELVPILRDDCFKFRKS